jgi:bifunctional N-acetylglucosamine-1-phosphate-uridyltransferase/glucosamine-1-phosphate-acetyltransferase GlmU-like protein
MASRLLTPLHPVAGRPLAWHALRALGALSPAPSRLVLVGPAELSAELFRDLPVAVDVVHSLAAVGELLGDTNEVLLLDAAAAVPGERLAEVAAGSGPRLLTDGGGAMVAARVSAAAFADGVAAPASLVDATPPGERIVDAAAVVVRDRAGLARATACIRDRIVRGHMAAGVSFLLPDTVLVDVDVRMGRDTIVYPGVVLEGSTEVGEETVIGPGCRLVDAWIGSGVELKGWNYISHASIRNRAILEPYVRRGFD